MTGCAACLLITNYGLFGIDLQVRRSANSPKSWSPIAIQRRRRAFCIATRPPVSHWTSNWVSEAGAGVCRVFRFLVLYSSNIRSQRWRMSRGEDGRSWHCYGHGNAVPCTQSRWMHWQRTQLSAEEGHSLRICRIVASPESISEGEHCRSIARGRLSWLTIDCILIFSGARRCQVGTADQHRWANHLRSHSGQNRVGNWQQRALVECESIKIKKLSGSSVSAKLLKWINRL